MISVALVDHTRSNRSWIRTFIEEHFSWINIIGEADSVASGLQLIYQKSPDLVLLDVNLEDGSGFELLDRVGGQHPLVIFISSCRKFTIQAIRQNALDYLCKPICPEELSNALFRAQGELSKGLAHPSGIPGPSNNHRIAVPTGSGMRYIEYANIRQVVADRSYCEIYLNGEEKPMVVSHKLKELQLVLEPQGFIRPNHSRLVNCRYVEEFQKAFGGTLKLTSGESITLSRHYKKQALLKLESLVDFIGCC